MTSEPRGYEAIQDSADLRIALRELRRVRAWIGQFADMMAESPDYGLEGVRAAKATAGMVNLLIKRAAARLDRLEARQAPDVVVVDPERRQLATTAVGGWLVLPMVTEPTVHTQSLSSALLKLDPGQRGVPVVYPDSDTIMSIVFGALDLLWWDSSGEAQEVSVKRHQQVHVRRGTRHCLWNTGAVPITLIQVRGTADITAGIELLPDLATDFDGITSASTAS